MMQETPPYLNLPASVNDRDAELAYEELAPERRATIWVSRITRVVGAFALCVALSIWLARPNHYRLVLALLMVAMFAAILHTYTFEDGP